MRLLRRRRVIVGSLGLVLLGASCLVATVAAADTGAGGALRIVGRMPVKLGWPEYDTTSPTQHGGPDAGPPPMIVDQEHDLGFTIEAQGHSDGNPALVVYDLERRLAVGTLDLTSYDNSKSLSPTNILSAGLDSAHHRIYLPVPAAGTTTPVPTDCGILLTLDYTNPDRVAPQSEALPCLGAGLSMRVYGASYDPGSNKLYVVGDDSEEDFAHGAGNLWGNVSYTSDAAALVLAEIDPATPAPKVDWAVNLVNAGCGRLDRPYFVQRQGAAVLSYCYDPTEAGFQTTGTAGYIVEVPLQSVSGGTDALVGQGGSPPQTDPANGFTENATIYRVPAFGTGPSYPDDPSPAIDPVSGRLLLTTSDPANGLAVWVFDPSAQRFVGVVTGGAVNPPPGDFSTGFDAGRGRSYILTPSGILVAPTRSTPLPTGTVYPVLADPGGTPYFSTSYGTEHTSPAFTLPSVGMAVAPSRRELFVPVSGAGWVVVEDDTQTPPVPPATDPDSLTLQVPEAAGVTSSTATGQALASGAHVLVVGGPGRTVDSADPFCTSSEPDNGNNVPDKLAASNPPPPLPTDPNFFSDVISNGDSPERAIGDNVPPNSPYGQGTYNSCLADRLLTPGNREAYVASTEVQVGTTTGAVATGSGLLFPSSDTADNQDFKTYGINSTGTQGDKGQGYPVPAAQCGDYGGKPTLASQPSGQPQDAFFSSKVICNAKSNQATAVAEADGFALPGAGPGPGAAQVAVGQTASSVASHLTKDGQVTTSIATAYGVVLGPVTIGEIESQATTVAHGHTGTAQTTFSRQWCSIDGPGLSMAGCIDPSSSQAAPVIYAIDQELQKLQIYVEPAQQQATPGGYQAVVAKDPGTQGADEAVNADSSSTVSGMEVVVYNDGSNGFNRLILQLAGVHAESRYGISLLPVSSGGTPAPVTPTATTLPSVPSTAPSIPLAAPSTSAAVAAQPVSFETGPGGNAVPVSMAEPAPATTSEPLIERIFQTPGEIIRRGLQLLVENPAAFGLLFSLWLLLAAPAYMAWRRRSLARALDDLGITA